MLGSFSDGEVTNGGWVTIANAQLVPPGTRWARVRLLAISHAGANKEYFDDLSLTAHTVPSITLEGSVVDDGLLTPSQLETQWRLVSGPAPVVLTDPNLPTTRAFLTAVGDYLFELTANDGELEGSDQVLVTVEPPAVPVNQAPVVNAGQDTTIDFPNELSLNGQATDDGSPGLKPLRFHWSKISGPGNVRFADSTLAQTTCGFSEAGTYVLRLVADDGALCGEDELVVTASCKDEPVPLDIVFLTDLSGSMGGHLASEQKFLKGMIDGLDINIDRAGLAGFGGGGVIFQGLTSSRPVLYDAVDQLYAADSFSNLSYGIYAAQQHFQTNGRPGADKVIVVVGDGVGYDEAASIAAAASARAEGIRIVGVGVQYNAIGILSRVVSSPGDYFEYFTTSDFASGAPTFRRAFCRSINHAPLVLAGGHLQTIVGQSVPLGATVNDDGLPVGSSITVGWRQVSGSGTARFANPAEAATSVVFDTIGTYGLEITASDGDFSASDVVLVDVLPQDQSNTPPVVDAGPDREVSAENIPIALEGMVTDDGLPAGSVLQIKWGKQSGPGTVNFTNPNSAATSASFSAVGDYVLELRAIDGERVGRDLVVIHVATTCDPLPDGISAWWTADGLAYDIVSNNRFDLLNGATYAPGHEGLSFTVDSKNDQIIAPSSPSLDISTGNGFTTEFWLCQTGSTGGTLARWGSNNDGPILSASTFGGFYFSMYGRDASGAIVGVSAGPVNNLAVLNVWQHITYTYDSPSGLLRIFLNGVKKLEKNIGSITPLTAGKPFRIMDFGYDRQPGSRMDDVRVYKRALTEAEVLSSFQNSMCRYSTNQPPIPDAGPDRTLNAAQTLYLAGEVTDDSFAGYQVGFQWSKVSGPGTVIFGSPTASTTSATFGQPGTYVLRLTTNDGQFANSDDVSVVVEGAPSGNLPPVVVLEPKRIVVAGTPVTFTGQVSDDGLPNPPHALTYLWEHASGYGFVQIQSPTAPTTQVTFSQPGEYILRLTANDSSFAGIGEAHVVVLPTGNQPPVVNAGTDQTIDFGQSAVLSPQIADDGLPGPGLTVQWTVVSGSGTVTFGGDALNPSVQFSKAGDYVLRLTADDGALTSTDEVMIAVTPGDLPPPAVALIAPIAGQSVASGSAVTLTATATQLEIGIDRVDFLVDGVYVGSGTAEPYAITWIATNPGTHTVVAIAHDNIGATSSSAPVSITVTPAAPTVSISYPLAYSAFGPGESVRVQANASPGSAGSPITGVEFLLTPANGGVSQTLGSDPEAPYELNWLTPATPSEYLLTARATDAAGQSTTSSPVLVRIAANPSEPTIVEITSLTPGASVTAPTPIIGTADGPAMASYQLDYRHKGSECDEWVAFASGNQRVTNDVLGAFDPTLLINGIYELRVTARDANGTINVSSLDVAVEGDMKVGHFTVAFQDLQVPLAGIPLTVTRTYDSREQCPGDFGYGWRLDVEGLRLEQSAPIGDGWGIVVTEGTLSSPSTYQLVDNVSHLLSVRMPDGEMLRFQPKLIVDRPYNRLASLLDGDGDDVGQVWLPFQYTQGLKIVYRAMGGTKGATLKARGYRAVNPWFGGGTDIDSSANVFVSEPYDGPINLAIGDNSAQDASLVTGATGWELTLKDGRVFFFDRNGRMESMRDPVGNTLTFIRNGAGQILSASHSSGKAVVFHRDGDGFIERITDPRGNEVNYGYDAAGHLRTFYDRETDPGTEAPTQSFTYKPGTHLVEDLFDGKGVRAVRNYFDAQGRLQRTVDAKGQETIFTHDIAGRTETIIDRAGNTTVHHYDERGNVTETRTPDGTVTRTQYHTWKDGRKSDLKTSESVTGLFTNDAGGLEQKTITTTYSYEDDNATTPLANDGLLRKIVDPLLNTTRMSYDERGNLLTITDPLTRTTANTYYPGTDLLHTITDAMGNVTTMTYDARGHLDTETRTVTVVDATGNTQVQTVMTDSDYDANGYLVGVKDALGHVTTYENDLHGNRLFERTTRTNAAGQLVAVVTEHEYDGNDRLLKTWDAEHPRSGGHPPTSETVYDENGKPSIKYDALRRSTSHFYNERGELERTEFADGTSEQFDYFAENDPDDCCGGESNDGNIHHHTNQRGKVTRRDYDSLGRLFETWFLGDGAENPVRLEHLSYDAAGRVYQSTDANGHTTTNVYDAAGRRTRTVDALSHVSISQYDGAGNLRFFTDANNHVTEHVYDNLNRRTAAILPAAPLDVNGDGTIDSSEQNVVTSMSTGYDELGRRVSETDANGRTKRFIYDKLSRLRQVVEPAPLAGDPINITEYTYDELSNQLTQTDTKLRTTHYSYDSIGRRLTRTLPLGQMESTQYDATGNQRFRTDFNGKTTEFQYDAMNRLRFRIPDASLGEPTVEWRYTATGQRERMIDGHGTTVYGYDSRDRLETKASPEGTLTYGHDHVGNVTSMASSNANGIAVTYRYDELNRLDEVEENGGEITSYGYDDVGNLERFTTSNGVAHVYGYNALNRLTGLTISNATQALATYSYTQLRTGHRSGASEQFVATPTNPQAVVRNARYGYDNLHRLRSEMITANAGPGGTVTYGLDSVGNRLSRTSTVAGLSNQAFNYDDNDRLGSDTYDANGNTKAGRVTLNSQGAETAAQTANDNYDSENRLVSRTIAGQPSPIDILYDGDGNKARETVNGQTTSYLIDVLNPTGYAQVVEELQNGTVIRTYTYGHDLLLQDQNNGGTWTATWFGYDGHGSVRFLTDALGQVTNRYDYDAFGVLLSSSGTTFNRYRYCGEQFEAALGFYYLRARYMNAANGRFWSMDAYEGDVSDPLSLHKYLYASADPVTFSDPSGRWSLSSILNTLNLRGLLSKMRSASSIRTFRRVTASLCRIGAIFVMPYNTMVKYLGKITPFQRHHIFQDAAMRDLLLTGYSYGLGFVMPLLGGSTYPNSPHARASRYQAKMSQYGWPIRKVAYGALLAAGCTPKSARELVKAADNYNKINGWIVP